MRQMERQSRVKSASPPPRKPKEPTPDLTDVPSVLVRKRRLNQWDIKPPGYENVTAEQAKLSGMFPLPGAPRQQPMDPSKLQAFMNQPGNQASTNALKPSTARQSKRLFVHRLPASATDDSVAEFFNLQLNGLNVTKGVDPCISAQVNQAQGYALLEFKNPEDATNAMALDGMSMEYNGMDTSSNGDSNGASNGLEIRRPKDYIVPTITDDTQHEAGVLSTSVPDTQNKIGITNIPVYLEDEQMQELLQSFGELKSFVLVRDTSSGQSRGIAYCEYMEPGVTDAAVEALNGMELGETKLKVKRASIGIQQVSGEMSVNAMSLMAGTQAKSDAESGRVLCLMNMITPEELMDTEESEGTFESMMKIVPDHILTKAQKFSTTSRKSAPSMARSLTPRCLVPPVADKALVLARFTSSTKSPLRRRRLWLRWLVGSLRTAQLWLHSLARSTLTLVRGRCLGWLRRKKTAVCM
jgi:splicing factor U2AF subunit